MEEVPRWRSSVDAMLMVACVVSRNRRLRFCVGGVIGKEAGDAGQRSTGNSIMCAASCECSGVRCTTQIIDAHGASIPDALMQAAQAFEADLIVMGAHGPRDVRRHLIGSVAEAVLRSSHVPVLTVRDDQRDDEHDAALAL